MRRAAVLAAIALAVAAAAALAGAPAVLTQGVGFLRLAAYFAAFQADHDMATTVASLFTGRESSA